MLFGIACSSWTPGTLLGPRNSPPGRTNAKLLVRNVLFQCKMDVRPLAMDISLFFWKKSSSFFFRFEPVPWGQSKNRVYHWKALSLTDPFHTVRCSSWGIIRACFSRSWSENNYFNAKWYKSETGPEAGCLKLPNSGPPYRRRSLTPHFPYGNRRVVSHAVPHDALNDVP